MTARPLLIGVLAVVLAGGCGRRGSYCSAAEAEIETDPCLEDIVFAGVRECRRTLRTACDAEDVEALRGELDCAREFRGTPPDCDRPEDYLECLRTVPAPNITCQAAVFRLYP